MEYSYCPNCKKMTGHKRALGMGTLLGAVVTGGTSLGAVPFYPKRCIICGNSEEGLPRWTYTCPKCGYKNTFDQRIKLFVCPQCKHEAPVKWPDDSEAKKKDSPASAIPPSEADILRERVENLRIRFNELGEKITDSKSKEEKARLKFEQKEIKDKMEKCRLEIFRIK